MRYDNAALNDQLIASDPTQVHARQTGPEGLRLPGMDSALPC